MSKSIKFSLGGLKSLEFFLCLQSELVLKRLCVGRVPPSALHSLAETISTQQCNAFFETRHPKTGFAQIEFADKATALRAMVA